MPSLLEPAQASPLSSQRFRSVPLSPRSLSPTSASTWQQCELKFAFVYLHRWQEPVTLPQLIGNTVHRAVELLYGSAPGERSRAAASEFMQLSAISAPPSPISLPSGS